MWQRRAKSGGREHKKPRGRKMKEKYMKYGQGEKVKKWGKEKKKTTHTTRVEC